MLAQAKLQILIASISLVVFLGENYLWMIQPQAKFDVPFFIVSILATAVPGILFALAESWKDPMILYGVVTLSFLQILVYLSISGGAVYGSDKA